MPFDGINFKPRSPEIIILDNAIEKLQSHKNWTRNSFGINFKNGNYRYCLLGAVNAVTREDKDPECNDHYNEHAVNVLWAIFDEISKDPEDAKVNNRTQLLDAIVNFNDHWRTKHKDVLALLYRTRDKLVEESLMLTSVDA